MRRLCGLDSVPRLIESHDGQKYRRVRCHQENLGKARMRKKREEKEDPEGSRMIKYGNSQKVKREGASQTGTCMVLVFYGMPTCFPNVFTHLSSPYIPFSSFFLFFLLKLHQMYIRYIYSTSSIYTVDGCYLVCSTYLLGLHRIEPTGKPAMG
jgi:hypothetical protein